MAKDKVGCSSISLDAPLSLAADSDRFANHLVPVAS